MADLNKKEKKFAEILASDSRTVDTSEIWDNISDRLPQKKERRPFIWFLFGLGMGMAVLATALLWNNSNSVASQQQTLLETETSDKTIQKTDQETTVLGLVSDNDPTEDLKDDNAANNVLISDASEYQNNKQTNTSQSSKIPNTINQINTNASANIVTSYVAHAQSPGMNEANIDKVIIGALGSDQTVPVTEEAVLALNESLGSDDLNLGIDLSDASDVRTVELLSLINELPRLRPDFAESLTTNALESNMAFSEVQLKHNRNWRGSLMIASGVDFGMIRNEAPGNTTLSESAVFTLESSRPGLSTDIIYRSQHRNGFSWLAGVSYRQIVGVYREANEVIETELIPEETTIIDDQGFVSTGTQLVERTTLYNYDRQIHRTHHQVDLQAGIGMRLIDIKTFSISTDAMLRYNIINSNNGYYFDANSAGLVKFAGDEQNVYRNSTGLSAQLALNLEFNRELLGLGIRPYWQYRPTSFTRSDAGYNLYQNSLGVQVFLTLKTF